MLGGGGVHTSLALLEKPVRSTEVTGVVVTVEKMNTKSLGSPNRFPSSPLSFTTLVNV